MAKVPMRFKRVTVAFDDVARARLCQSSGSEHSAAENSLTDLSDLVDSFFEREGYEDAGRGEELEKQKKVEEEGDCVESESYCTESETKEMLMSLMEGESEQDEDRRVKQMICGEMETACRSLGNSSSEGFKRRAMIWLRQKGFDAGLCKSRWEIMARHPAGEYEYIDILISGNRYIVDVSLNTEFTIARPTKPYASLLKIFPYVVVFLESEMKQAVRLMCSAMRESMKKSDIHVPPWRRNGYMLSKWFGSYKRTTNAASTPIRVSYGGIDGVAGRSFVGFDASAVVQMQFNCRGEFERKVGVHVGNLKAAFNGMA